MELQQRLPHGLRDPLADGALVVELHLAFGGMDVHIDERGIDFEEQAADGVAAFHQRGVVALDEREVDAAILDRAAVDEDMLLVARRAGEAGCADEAPEMDCRLRIADCRLRERGGCIAFLGGVVRGQLFREIDGDQLLIAAGEGAHPLAQRVEAGLGLVAGRHGGQLPDGAAVLEEGEGDVRVRQRGEGEVMVDVGRLGLFGAEKLAGARAG